MPDEIDFSRGARGQCCRPNAKLNPPAPIRSPQARPSATRSPTRTNAVPPTPSVHLCTGHQRSLVSCICSHSLGGCDFLRWIGESPSRCFHAATDSFRERCHRGRHGPAEIRVWIAGSGGIDADQKEIELRRQQSEGAAELQCVDKPEPVAGDRVHWRGQGGIGHAVERPGGSPVAAASIRITRARPASSSSSAGEGDRGEEPLRTLRAAWRQGPPPPASRPGRHRTASRAR